MIAVLKAGNAGLDTVIKTTVFLKDMNDFEAMNKVYSKRFSGTEKNDVKFPAR